MNAHPEREITMLYTIAVILLIAWLLGIVGTYTIGAFVHVLLVIAIVLFVVGLLSGRRSLA
jgi:asparagine N-glycosylation enzyme membrane subunit Stt3